MPLSSTFRPARTHEDLGAAFFDVVHPADFPQQRLRYRNDRQAGHVGLETLSDAEWIDHFGWFVPLPGSLSSPLALRYHGHQFRHYNADLGDGRGFLFAQMFDDAGRLLDLGTKGSGTTPWSRGGDGRLTLKGGVREVLATTMLEALGVDTSKSCSLIETGEALMRGDEPSPTRSAFLVRLSHSHIRIGTFQRLAYRGETDNIVALIDHVVRHYMPEAVREDQSQQALAFLGAVAERVARTGAAWMAAGFVHGVLNTDNINVTGESFDYGPWRFLPQTLMWNLARLAECLLPLASKEQLEAVLGVFPDVYRAAFDQTIIRRLGLISQGAETDRHLAEAFWTFLAASQVPFEQAFFDWFGGTASRVRSEKSPVHDAYRHEAMAPFAAALEAYAPRIPGVDKIEFFAWSKPPTLLIDEVERIWSFIDENDDWSAFHDRLAAIEQMRIAYAL
jgi:serine/tyrosine/threonine adenylyltransferase